ncbi:MAG: FAD-dependent oxidoreductase, partial [Vicinamibacteria bacterium]
HQSPRVAVVGAGAFGGWTALHLRRKGAAVTLVDAWGPGNSRASSGGETRVIRGGYGADRIYVDLVVRSFELWKEAEARWKRRLYHRTGALWLVHAADDAYERAFVPILRAAGLEVDELTTADAQRRFPQISFDGVSRAIYEHEAGYLLARRSCQAVQEAAVAEGVDYRQRSVSPRRDAKGRATGLELSDGNTIEADAYVFACGPWLSELFPELAPPVSPTRQEVFYFGTQAADARYLEASCPVWIDRGERVFYGIPGNEWRGFKVADDSRGSAFDPTSSDRRPSEEGIKAARAYLEMRFPGMKGAPLLESRVCQYEQSPDGHFIIDRHPASANVLLVGGGSGHGFKHGPAVGELAAANVLGEKPLDPFFSLARFR